MNQENCPHEDDIMFGATVYKDATVLVELVTCSDCGAKGAQYQQWDDDNGDYVFLNEAWHKS